MIWIWLKNCQAQVQVQVRWRWVFFVSNELKWPKLAIFGLFEGHRSPKMPFFTGIRPGSTSAHLNHEFLGWVPPSSSQKNGQLSVKWGKMVKIGQFWGFWGPKMTLSAWQRPDITSANLSLDSYGWVPLWSIPKNCQWGQKGQNFHFWSFWRPLGA